MVGFSSWVLRRVGELSDRVMEISEGSENLRQAEIVHSEKADVVNRRKETLLERNLLQKRAQLQSWR